MALQHPHPMDLGVNGCMSQRWHPALLQQEEQLLQCGSMGQGSHAVWPGRIVGTHRHPDHQVSHPLSAYETLICQLPGDAGCQAAAGGLAAASELLRQQSGQPPGPEQYDAALAHHLACCSFDGESPRAAWLLCWTPVPCATHSGSVCTADS